VIGALFILAETLLLREDGEPPTLEMRSGRQIRPSEAMGWEPIPSVTVRSKKVRGDQVLYDVVYSFDEAGRRIVPVDPGRSYGKFLLFFGGSNTFGEGLEAEESLPYQTSRHLPGVRAYNYAFRGYGPQHLLAKLEATDLRAEVEEPEGLAIYVLLGFHMNRLLGSSQTMSWVDDLPYYRAEGGRLVRRGFFQTTRPVYSWLMKHIGSSRLLQRLGVAWPLRSTDSHRALVCQLFAQAREELTRQFAGTDLLVALHPKGETQRFPCFEEVGIRTLDLRDAYGDVPEPELSIPGDGHVNGGGNRLLGKELARALEPFLFGPQ
jgi:hypothetical protein